MPVTESADSIGFGLSTRLASRLGVGVCHDMYMLSQE
jgi:hypothetical protein